MSPGGTNSGPRPSHEDGVAGGRWTEDGIGGRPERVPQAGHVPGMGPAIPLRPSHRPLRLTPLRDVGPMIAYFGCEELPSRGLLFHVPCSSSARKLNPFWRGWLTPELALGCAVTHTGSTRWSLIIFPWITWRG